MKNINMLFIIELECHYLLCCRLAILFLLHGQIAAGFLSLPLCFRLSFLFLATLIRKSTNNYFIQPINLTRLQRLHIDQNQSRDGQTNFYLLIIIFKTNTNTRYYKYFSLQSNIKHNRLFTLITCVVCQNNKIDLLMSQSKKKFIFFKFQG